MQSPKNYFSKSINILHVALIAVVVTYLSEIVLSLIQPNLLYLFLVILPTKTILLSGFYGSIVDIIKGEEPYLTKKSFFKNVKKLWWIYLIITQIFPGLFYISSLLTNNAFADYYPSFFAHFKIFITALLAFTIIHFKYPDKIHASQIKPKQKLFISMPNAGRLFLLYITSLFIFHIPHIFPMPNTWSLKIFTLTYIYVEYLIFIFLSIFFMEKRFNVPEQFAQQKELIIINPLSTGFFYPIMYSVKGYYPAIVSILYAMTPKNYKIRVINNVPFKKQFYKGNCLVAITCYTPNCFEAYKIAKEFRSHGSKVIMGGPHVSVLPNEALAFCDSVVIGEAESVWADIIKDYENNNLQEKYFAKPLENWSAMWHKQMLHIPSEILKSSLETTRGCPFSCNFCTSPNLVGTSIRTMPLVELVELIKKIRPKYRAIYFNDANIFSNPKHAKELFKALIPLKIKWMSHATLNIAKDDEALDLAKKSGCSFLAIGLETNDTQTAQSLGGKFGMIKKYCEFVKKIKNKGIHVLALFILGFEKDNFMSYFKILHFVLKILPYSRAISHLTPFPGTQLYFDYLGQNRLINQNWRKYDLQSFVFKNNFWNLSIRPPSNPNTKHIKH